MLNGTRKIIKHKVGLLNLAEELGNVSAQACRIMGLSRDTFYRYKSAVDEGGIEGEKNYGTQQHHDPFRITPITRISSTGEMALSVWIRILSV